MVGLDLSVLVALAAVNLALIVWAMWLILQNLKEIEETIDQFGRVR